VARQIGIRDCFNGVREIGASASEDPGLCPGLVSVDTDFVVAALMVGKPDVEAEEFGNVARFDDGAERDGEEALGAPDRVEEGGGEGGGEGGVEDGPDEGEVGGIDEGVEAGFEAHVGDSEGETGEVDGDFRLVFERFLQYIGPFVKGSSFGIILKKVGERFDIFWGGFSGYGNTGEDCRQIFRLKSGCCI